MRYYGFLSARHRQRLEKVKERLHVKPATPEPPAGANDDVPAEAEVRVMRCPQCGGVMQLVGDIAPKRTRAP